MTINDINGEHTVIDLQKNPETQKYLFNDTPSEKDIKALNQWLLRHRDDYVRLYHGTSSRIPVKEKGLLKTSRRTKKSLQSQTGYVYLSVFPGMARTFGEIAYPHDDVTVYAVDIKIRELLADKDQLANKRMWAGVDCGDTLADSLIYGHGARVKRNINPWEIKETSF